MKYLILFAIFLQDCTKKTSASSLESLSNGYNRGDCSFHWYKDSVQIDEENIIVNAIIKAHKSEKDFSITNYLIRNEGKLIKPKKEIDFQIKMDIWAPSWIVEPVSLYVNQKNVLKDSCLSRVGFKESSLRKINHKEFINYTFQNPKLAYSARFSFYLTDKKIFFDTIIPLTFRNIDIYIGDNHAEFTLQKIVD